MKKSQFVDYAIYNPEGASRLLPGVRFWVGTRTLWQIAAEKEQTPEFLRNTGPDRDAPGLPAEQAAAMFARERAKRLANPDK